MPIVKKYLLAFLCLSLFACQSNELLDNAPTEDKANLTEHTGETPSEGRQTPSTSEGVAQASAELSAADKQTLQALVDAQMKTQNIPGLAVAIVKPGKTLFSAGYGLANVENQKAFTADTLHIIASISKTLTYTHLLQQVDKGRVQLDADINTYLPFEVKHPQYPDMAITPRMLLNHSAGIADNDEIDVYSRGVDSPISLASFMADYFSPTGKYYSTEQNFLEKEPGSAFNYSNMGTALAGYLVEAVTQTDYAQSSQNDLLKPLRMTHSGWYLKNIDQNLLATPYEDDNTPLQHYTFADYPNGQLRSSANELSHFLAMLMNKGAFNGQRILSESLMADLRKEGVPGSGYALGFTYSDDVEGRNLFGHSGSEQGTSTAMFYDVETQTGAIVLINKQDKDYTPLLESLLNIGDKY